jgi:omega-3 fatty acid desaturase (delta-15 desaturase)
MKLAEKEAQALQLNSILKAIPEKAFEKSLTKSLAYMLFDYAMWGGSFLAMLRLVKSATWAKMALWQKAAASLTYWNVAGFFMWTIFVVGHDCGHTTFSKHKWLNNVIGHLTHGSILVPFFPWQLSHRRHHMFHNHIDKDYSYQWFTPEKEHEIEAHPVNKWFHSSRLARAFMPFFGTYSPL